MKNQFSLLLFIIIFFSHSLSSQSQDISISRKYIVKLRLISTIEMISNVDKQIIGLEYEQKINNKSSFILNLDMGYFDKYIYYKYYDFFSSVDELPYTKREVITKGFHISPNYKYYFYPIKNTSLSGFSIGGAIDYSFYRKKYYYYDSRTNNSTNKHYNSQQIAIGGVLGFQYLIKNRISIDLSSSLFAKVISHTNNGEKEVCSKNSFWVSKNESFWAVYRLKLGYAFGK